jgi:hypothetical protein
VLSIPVFSSLTSASAGTLRSDTVSALYKKLKRHSFLLASFWR